MTKRYRDNTAYAIAAAAALGAGAIIDGGIAHVLLKHAGDGPAMAPLWIKLQWIFRIGAACMFLTWFDSAYANIDAMYGTTYPRWWAIAGFFVPPFAIFRPCEMAVEMWRRTSDRDDEQPILVYVWWVAFLQMVAVIIISRPVMQHVSAIAAAATAIALIAVLTRRLDAAHLIAQREERQLAAGAKRAAAIPPEPVAPQAAPAIAPQLAAFEAAAAQRAAERRAKATYGGTAVTAPAPQPQIVRPEQREPRTEADVPRRAATRPIAVPLVVPRSRPALAPGAVWTLTLAIFLGVAAVAMLAAAAHIGFNADGLSRLLAAIYAGAGLLIAFLAHFIGRLRSSNEAAAKWAMITLAGAVVAIANIITIVGIVIR